MYGLGLMSSILFKSLPWHYKSVIILHSSCSVNLPVFKLLIYLTRVLTLAGKGPYGFYPIVLIDLHQKNTTTSV